MSALLLSLLAAAPVSIGPDFQGFEQRFTLNTDSDLGEKHMNDCGFKGTTKAPALTFTIAGVNDVVLELGRTNAGGVLVRGPQHRCLKPGVTDVEPGSYELYLLDGQDHPSRTNATVRLFSKAAQAKKLREALQKVPVSGQGPNPIAVRTSGKTAAFDASTIGVPCAKGSVQPVAELVVKDSSRYTLTLEGGERDLFLVSKSGCEALEADAVDLEPGAYTLWMETAEFDALVKLTDTERGLAMGDEHTLRVSLTKLPMVLRVPVQATAPRDAYADVSFVGRTPAFIIEPGGAAAEVHVRSVAGPRDLRWDATGDLGTIKRAGRLQLATKKRWFVFADTPVAGEAVVAFTDPANPELPVFWTPGDPGTSLDARERVVAIHFPFWHLPDYELPPALPLFATAPAGLFVFLTKEVNEVPTTEPLLLLAHDGKSATLLRLNGEQLTTRAALLSTEVPASLSFPKAKTPPPATTTDDAWADAGPFEKPRVDAWVKRQKQWTDCIEKYMQKNDPAWGKSYELIYVRSGLNVSDVVYASARKACGESKFNADGQAFIKAINGSHAKLAASIEGMLKKRLGR